MLSLIVLLRVIVNGRPRAKIARITVSRVPPQGTPILNTLWNVADKVDIHGCCVFPCERTYL